MPKVNKNINRPTYVYRHRRLDTNEIFYVGISITKYRPYTHNNRNKFWKNIVSKTKFKVEIIFIANNWEDACELEELLILEYGRRDLGKGTLVNLTNGGDGTTSIIRTKETKIKMSIAKKGKTYTKKHCNNISLSRIGKEHPQKGISVIDIKTGIIYKSIAEAARQFNTTSATIHRYVNGMRKNKTNLKLVN